VLVAVGTAAAAGGAPRGRVTVAAQATVHAPTIRLADIATLEGDDVAALGATGFGPAPTAGETRTLEGAAVLQALHREAGTLDNVTYTIPALVRVRRAAQDVSETAVRKVLEDFLAETLGTQAENAVLRTVELPGPIRIPEGAYRARVISPPGVPLLGRVRLQIEFMVDDRPAKSVWVTADIGLYGPVVVARRPIGRGERVGAADVTVARRDRSQFPGDVLGDAAEAEGLFARGAIAAASPIRRQDVAVPPVVHRGDVVLLVAQRAGLRITTPGEVREDAALSQSVRVVNRSSRKEVTGSVLDASTVVVDF